MYTNSDCTIFHRVYDEVEMQDTWVGFYIPSCFWDFVARATRISSGFEKSDTVFVAIPDVEMFKEPKEYNALVDKTGYWTIGMQDKIVKGNVDLLTPIEDVEANYDNVLTVLSVDPKIFGSSMMHHVEVGGS